MLYDISPRIDAGTPVWPGDTAFAVHRLTSIADGATVNLTSITTTPHLGAHADAPLHSERDGASIADVGLEAYLGPCRVMRVPPQPLIEPHHLKGVDVGKPPRLLLRTESVRGRADFPRHFSALSPALAALFVERGVLLVGIDTPSVDPFDSKTLEVHHTLFRHGVANLEGLNLEGVPEGVYELIALPLKLAGACASPVRAILRTLE
ncbi:MAG: arylformamidase [Acidobacteriota bacterium]